MFFVTFRENNNKQPKDGDKIKPALSVAVESLMLLVVCYYNDYPLQCAGGIGDVAQIGLKGINHHCISSFIIIYCIECFCTATFANVLDRLQNRIFWVLPATNIIVLLEYYVGKGKAEKLPASL